jgi:predicted transcriptional regulator
VGGGRTDVSTGKKKRGRQQKKGVNLKLMNAKKKTRQKTFFDMHYSPNLHWVLNMQLHHNINAAEMICYIFFLNHCNDGECQLYMDTIAEGLGVSKRQAARYINKLISAGLIERERPKVFGAPANIYRIAR